MEFGHHGSESDGGIFGRSEFHIALERGEQGLPADTPLCGIGNTPYFFVGDEAFPLKTYLMRPYSRKSKFSRLFWYSRMLQRSYVNVYKYLMKYGYKACSQRGETIRTIKCNVCYNTQVCRRPHNCCMHCFPDYRFAAMCAANLQLICCRTGIYCVQDSGC